MSIKLNGFGFNSAVVPQLSALDQKIKEAIDLDLLVLRVNVGASDKFNQPTLSNPDKNSKVILSSNKGQIMWSSPQKGDQVPKVFAVVAQHGIVVYNSVTKKWDLPPASVKNKAGVEVPTMTAKPSALSALMIQALKQMAPNEQDQISLGSVWDEEFNFDLPFSKEEAIHLREICLAERNSFAGKKMTRSMVLACRFYPHISEEGMVFKIKVVSILSVEEAPIDLPNGEHFYLGSANYAQAALAAEETEIDETAIKEKMQTAALNFVSGGSRNSRRNKNKKVQKKAQADMRSEGSTISMSAIAGSDAEVEKEEVDATSISASDIL